MKKPEGVLMYESKRKTKTNGGNSMKSPASTTYAHVFAPHHNWAIGKAVVAGMHALPTKAQLLTKLNEDAPEVVEKPGDSSLSRLKMLYTQAKDLSES
ncbi:hypothetical protein AgCh_017317 [Apium graveolens]